MTSTARFPDVFRRARIAALVLLAAAGLAGCSQEGKTVQNTLPVSGIAYDVTAYSETTVVDDKVPPVDTFRTTVSMDVRLKLETAYRNLCEARGGLELRVLNTATPRLDDDIYVVTPLARYTADEECNVGASGDTLQTLLINLPIKSWYSFETPPVFARMQVVGESGPPIEFEIRQDLATPGADSTLYDIKVEDAASGVPIEGALVSVQQYGTPNILGEGTTSALGRFSFSVAYGILPGAPGDAYIVKVSYAGRITLLEVIDFPSLSRRREAIIVRV
jgi:hypothetical protein